MWMDEFLKWIMSKKTTTTMPPEPPEPPVPSEPEEPCHLKGYRFENSDSYPGESYVMLERGMRGSSVRVGNEIFKYRKDWNGRETYYGPLVQSFEYPLTITVITTSNDICTDTVQESPAGPMPEPPEPPIRERYSDHFHHYNPRAFDARGVALVLCVDSPHFDSMTINTQRMRYHGKDKGRDVWTTFGTTNPMTGIGGIIKATKGNIVTLFKVSGDRGMEKGECWGRRS